MQQKATENIKHICRRNTPTGGQRQIPLCVRVCLYMYLCKSANEASALDPVSLCGPHRGVGCVLWIISWWRSWLAVEQRKLCPASAAQLWPFYVREQILWTQNCSDYKAVWREFRARSAPCSQFNVCKGKSDSQEWENNIPHTYRVCLLLRFSQSCKLSPPLFLPPPLLLNHPRPLYSSKPPQ